MTSSSMPGGAARVSVCEKTGGGGGGGGSPAARSYTVRNVTVPEAVTPRLLVIVTVTSTSKVAAGGSAMAFSSPELLAST